MSCSRRVGVRSRVGEPGMPAVQHSRCGKDLVQLPRRGSTRGRQTGRAGMCSSAGPAAHCNEAEACTGQCRGPSPIAAKQASWMLALLARAAPPSRKPARVPNGRMRHHSGHLGELWQVRECAVVRQQAGQGQRGVAQRCLGGALHAACTSARQEGRRGTLRPTGWALQGSWH